MSIKTDQIVSNQLLPLSQLSTIGTENDAWDKLYGSFASFTFPAGSPADLDMYWQHSRLYAGDPLNFEGYINGPAGHTPEVGDLLIVLPENGTSQKQILITPTTIYQRSGTNQGDWNEWIELLTTGNYAKWVPKLDGSNVDTMSIWPINISGNAESASTAEGVQIHSSGSSGKLVFSPEIGSASLLYLADTIQIHNSGDNSYITAPDFIFSSGKISLKDSKISLAGVPVSIINGAINASTLRTNLGLSSALHYVGTATVPIEDGTQINPQIEGYDFINNRTPGDVVLWSKNEYIWSTAGKWEILGEGSSFKLKQENVNSETLTPTLGGNSFISDISQDQNGIITPIKKQIAPLILQDKFNQTLNYDGSNSLNISLLPRRSVVGFEGEGSRWFKVATTNADHFGDREITFKVSTALGANNQSGVLRAHVRAPSDAKDTYDPKSQHLMWDWANTGIKCENFVLVTKREKPQVYGELFVKTTPGLFYHFDVIQENTRRERMVYWQLYSTRVDDNYALWDNNIESVGLTQEQFDQYLIDNGFKNEAENMSGYLTSTLMNIKNNSTTASSLSGTRTANTVLAAPNGSNGTATFRKLVAADLPMASATEAGIITTGTQSLAGNKTFTGATAFKSAPTILCQNNTQHNHMLKFANINGELIGGIVNDIGTATNNIAYNKIGFRSYSATDPNGTSTTDKYEVYYLPETTDNISSNVGYNILTTKTHSWDILDNRYINAAGDSDITGNLVMTNDGGMIKISSKTAHDDGTTYGVALHVGSHLVNRGLFDITNNKWMVYKDTEMDVVKTPSLFQAPQIILTNTTDAKLEKYDTVALTIGSSAAQHLEFDNNEIMSKTNASTAGILGLNMEGSVQLGKMILQSSNYGTLAPTDSNNTNTSSPVNGQIYFQLIE